MPQFARVGAGPTKTIGWNDMTVPQKLEGLELIDCAKASANQGLATAARQCGYGENTEAFEAELIKACQKIGIEIDSLGDLITDRQQIKKGAGIEIAPDSSSSL
jgi:hypothetical protein